MNPVSALTLTLFEVVDYILYLYSTIVILQVILTWLIAFNVINTSNRFVRGVGDVLDRVTEPVFARIRRVVPPFNGIDFSPLILLLVIWALRRFLMLLVLG